MKISVLIPFRGNGDVLRDENFGHVWTQWLQFLGEGAEIIIGDSPASAPFNLTTARNNAAKRSKGDVLIFADADTLFQPHCVSEALGMIMRGEREWVVPYDHYYNATAPWSASWKARPHPLTHPPAFEHDLPSVSGVLAVSRKAYDEVGGFDERFIGWGWEDLAFTCALGSLFGNLTRVPGFVVHLYHHRSVAENFGQPNEPANHALYNRYCEVEHDQEAMRALIKEHHSCELT